MFTFIFGALVGGSGVYLYDKKNFEKARAVAVKIINKLKDNKEENIEQK